MIAAAKPHNKAVIPHQVRFNKFLNASEKMFYGELVALCGSKNHCWAKNSYFAALYDKSTKSISRWLSKLEKLGYIRTAINREMFDRREIHLLPLGGSNESPGIAKDSPGVGQNFPSKPTSLFIYNNNDNNNDESEWTGSSRSNYDNEFFSFFNGATPSVEQVRACMLQLPGELTTGIDLVDESRKFYVNYSANGWMMGSAKMKNLAAAVEKWITLSNNFNKKLQSNEQYNRYNPKQSLYTHLHAKQYEGDTF